MIRRVIEIDEEKCTGCGICADACHEGAIEVIDGKAKLTRDDYCDGLGDCLPSCPEDAISFVEREAAAYDEQAVKENMARKAAEKQGSAADEHAGHGHDHGGMACPGSQMHKFKRGAIDREDAPAAAHQASAESQLGQWPCQIKLVPTNADYFDEAKLLIAADCTAFAYANLHQEFMRGKITLIGCPKLDDIDYSEKLTTIIADNDIQSVTIIRMEVPCCGGLEMATKKALQASGRFIPWNVVTVSIDGKILD